MYDMICLGGESVFHWGRATVLSRTVFTRRSTETNPWCRGETLLKGGGLCYYLQGISEAVS